MNIHHIGYVVKEIQAATQEFALFGYHKETAGGLFMTFCAESILFL